MGNQGMQWPLIAGETILWQGRPRTDLEFEIRNGFFIVWGGVAIVFGVFWIRMVLQISALDQNPISGPMLGLIWGIGFGILMLGVYIALYNAFGASFKRYYTWYCLSSRRAFIAVKYPHRLAQIKSYPIRPETPVEYVNGRSPKITFAQHITPTEDGPYKTEIGFSHIENGPDVYRMMRSLQENQQP